jgi:hypothetical protein
MSRRMKMVMSQEAIAYQKDKKLFLAVTNLFRKFNEVNDTSKEAFKALEKELAKTFKDITKITFNVTIDVGHFSMVNAYVEPPMIKPSSPLWESSKDLMRMVGPEEMKKIFDKGMKEIRKIQQPAMGSVDLKTGQVGGVYTKIPVDMHIGAKLFAYPDSGKFHLTPEEAASIVLHEIGHVYSYFECMSDVVMTNIVLDGVVKALQGEEKEEVRVRLIDNASKALDATVDAKTLAKYKDGTVIQTALLDSHIRDAISTTGARAYEFRNFEFLSDQFATLQGAGGALASAVEKLAVYYDFSFKKQNRYSWLEFYTTIVQNTLLILVSPLLALLLMVPGLDEATYDDPRDRIERVKRQLIQASKDTQLSQVQRDNLLKDIGRIDETLSHLRTGGQYPMLFAIWRTMTKFRRDQRDYEELHKQLENLASNDLFVASQRLASLSQAVK